MKIAILTRRLYPPGGAERTMTYIAEKLSIDHTVKVFGFSEEKGEIPDNAVAVPMPNGTSLPVPRLNKALRHLQRSTKHCKPVQQFDPDLILAHHRPALITPYLKQVCDANVAIFLHDLSQIEFSYGSLPGRVYSQLDSFLHQITYQQADLVVANSKFTARKFNSEYGFYPSVVYPCVDLETHRTQSTGDHILFVNPTYDKGVDIAIEVAKQLSNEQFLFIGPKPNEKSIIQQISTQENIDFQGYVDDMSNVFEETKLVIYPSRCQEAFGRVPIEAGASGIPTVATSRGGLPESVGIESAIVQSDSPNDFVNRILCVLNNYPEYSKASRLNAWRKSGDAQFTKLLFYLNTI